MSFFWLSDNAVILQADGKALKDVSTEKPASEVTSTPTDQSHADVSSVKVTIAAQQWLLWYHAIFFYLILAESHLYVVVLIQNSLSSITPSNSVNFFSKSTD